jgi:hypothetical protein
VKYPINPAAEVRPAEDLDALAYEINAAHKAGKDANLSSLKHYREAGDKLLKARKACGHGTWLAWLKANLTFSQATAYRYMEWAKLLDSRSLPEDDWEEAWRGIPGNAAGNVADDASYSSTNNLPPDHGVGADDDPDPDPAVATSTEGRQAGAEEAEDAGQQDAVDDGDDAPAAPAEPEPAPAGELRPLLGKGVIRAKEATGILSRIPKDDALRKRGFQIVADWIRDNASPHFVRELAVADYQHLSPEDQQWFLARLGLGKPRGGRKEE